jgi:hypothetical protein
MLSLREYRNKADRLADFLPWAALVAPGVVLNKDGSFQRSARFRGPDLDSATPAELIARPRGSTARCAGWVRAGRSSSRRCAARRRTIPKATFPIRPPNWSSANAPRSSPRKARISRASYFLTCCGCRPPRTPRAPKAGSTRARPRKGINPKELLDLFIDRTDRLLRPGRRLRARSRLAR